MSPFSYVNPSILERDVDLKALVDDLIRRFGPF
jgi:hypothetical protein